MTLKRKKKVGLKKLKDKAWEACSRYIRIRDSIKTTGTTESCVCVTCGKTFPTFGKGCIQAGHWLGGRRGLNLFDERGIVAQCFGCNCMAAGKQVEFSKFMLDTYGHELMDELIRQGNMPYQYTADELIAIREKYERLAEGLTK